MAETYDYEGDPREYREGAAAFRRGRRLADNPHDFGTDAHDAWSQGWEEAMTQDAGFTK